MYSALSSLGGGLSLAGPAPPVHSVLVKLDREGGWSLHALTDAGGTRRPPQLVSAEVSDGGGDAPLGLGGVAQRLLASAGRSWVLDGDAFVGAAAALPPAQLHATLENCLAECTNTRLARLDEHSGFNSSKVNLGVAGLVQHVSAPPGAGHTAGGDGGGAAEPELFPPSAGIPTLGALLRSTVLPPSATAHLVSQPAAHLFAAHSQVGAGRRSAAEHFDVGSVPSLHTRGRSHIRSAARRGGKYFTLLSGMPVWQWFELEPPAELAAADLAPAPAQGRGKAQAQRQSQQQQHKRKHPAAGSSGAAGPSRQQLRPPCTATGAEATAPGTLTRSACSCSFPDLGVLWCAHRCDALAGLLSDPALHVLDCNALDALLAPLSARQLAQLLLTVALAGGTLPDVVLSLQLPPASLAALFVPSLGSLPLPLPLTSDLRLCCYSQSDAMLSYHYSGAGADPYAGYPHKARDGATAAANPLQAAHSATRLSVLSCTEGSALQAVERCVRPLSPQLVWHLKGMGVDALDLFPEAVGSPNAAGIWPMEVRSGMGLGFEDALGLVRALSMLGSGYAPVALQLLKDLTITAAHPQYCTVSLPAATRTAFARRLAQLWERLTTPEERWALFLDGGMRLPAVWSECVREVAWQAVGQFPVLWALARHLRVAVRGTSRAAAMALLTRTSVMPRTAAGAGVSAFTDLLLFERSMQRGLTQHAEGLSLFLRQKQGQLRPAREGSLLQCAARNVARHLLADTPLAQSHALFQGLILDLQESVLAEAASLLLEAAYSDVPSLMAPEAGEPGDPEAQLPPPMMRMAGTVLKSHTVGVLNTGLVHNADGLDRHALPPHLPPALASSPFNWVTLDVRAMLALPSPRSAAACWAAAYLQLAPKYSPAGAVPLWGWLRQAGTLGLLLGCAVSAVARRDWHVAAMLSDSGLKYLQSSATLAPQAAAAEQVQLQAARPLLRTLAVAAAAQLRTCLALLAPPPAGSAGTSTITSTSTSSGGSNGEAAVLTHTSSLRACCLLLRAVLALMAEALEPLLSQPAVLPGMEMAAAGLPLHLFELLELELPPNMQAMLDMHQQAIQQAQAALQAAQVQAAAATQAAQEAQAAMLAVQQGLGEEAGGEEREEEHQQEEGEDAVAEPAAAGQPAVPPALPGASPSVAAAAVVRGRPQEQAWTPAAVEALVADASALMQVAQVALELSIATLRASPLLPLASSCPSPATSTARQRQQQDTALWRAAELSSEYDQYPYHHDAGEDGPQSRSFALNEVLLLLSQALPVALLPLLRPTATGQQQGEQQQQQQQQQQQAAPQQRAGRSRTGRQNYPTGAAAAPGSQGQQRQEQQQRVQHGERQSAQSGLDGAVLALLPLADSVGTRLVETMEEGDCRHHGGNPLSRLKHAAPLSLLCCVLHLGARADGGAGAAQLAAMPSVWKLLSSHMLDVVSVAANRPNGGGALRLTWLAPPTLLRMLRACSVAPATNAAALQAAANGVVSAGGAPVVSSAQGAPAPAAALCQQQPGQQAAGQEPEEEQQPAFKRRRRSGRQGKATVASGATEPAPGSAAAGQAAGGRSRAAPSSAAAAASGRADAAGTAAAGAAAGTAAAAAGTTASGRAAKAAAAGEPPSGSLWVVDRPVEVTLVQAAVQRVLTWLSAGTQENWRGSNYAQWRPRQVLPLGPPAPIVPPPPIQPAQPGGVVLEPAAAGGEQQAAGGAAAQAQPQPNQQQQQQVQAPPHNAAQALFAQLAAGLAVAPLPAGGAGAGAGEPGPPLLARPGVRLRQAFLPRQPPSSAVAAALCSHWPVSAIEVLQWWLQHRAQLQPAEMRTGPAAMAAAAAAPAHAALGLARELAYDLVPHTGADAQGNARADSREESFATLDGPVRLAGTTAASPRLRLMGGTLLTLLCMECAPEVHAATAAALLAVARQPGAAAELADSAAFWVLQRLLLRSGGDNSLPPAVAAFGRQVVQETEAALLADSGDWAAVLSCQAAVAADAEAVAVERRAAASAAAAAGRVAGGAPPVLDGAGNPLLPQPPPPWHGINGPFDPFDPLNMDAMQGLDMGPGALHFPAEGFEDGEWDDEDPLDEEDEFDDEDIEDEEEMMEEMMGIEGMPAMGGGPPWGPFF